MKVVVFLCLATSAMATPSDRLLDAIRQVESGGGKFTVGDNGKAKGPYQLWTIYVDDVNRILGKKVYTYADRDSETKSREMVRTVLKHYSKGIPLDKLAVIHINPSQRFAWNRPAAKEYLRKIQAAMK